MLAYLALPLLLVSAGPEPAYHLEIAEAKRIEAELTVEVFAPKFVASEWVVFAGRLPLLPGQTEVASSLKPGGEPKRELTAMHRPILEARLPAKGEAFRKGFKIVVQYEATLHSRSLVALKPGRKARIVPPLNEELKKLLLEPSEILDFQTKIFQKWLDVHQLRRQESESDLDFARRAFLKISKSFTYVYPVPHDGKSSSVCKAGRGDCGSMSAMFVSTMRANGVPARALVGHWAESQIPAKKPGEDTNYQTHVKAEFHADGIGWVPVDQTAGLGDNSPTGLRFFGHDPGNFIVQNVDFDMLVDTVHFGRQRVTILQGAPYWASGKGTLDGTKTQEFWEVKTLPKK